MRQGVVILTKQMKAKLARTRNLVVPLAVFVALCSLVTGCEGPQQVAVEELPASQPAPAPEPVHLPKLSPPKLLEVQEVVKRVFKDAASIDDTRSPNFIVGDFNGDRSQDIVVVLRVSPGKVADMNEEFPVWILRDLASPGSHEMGQLRVEENEVLLAVIHGYGAYDWRDPEATQTFLLKNAVGSRMEVRTGKEFIATNNENKMPLVHGDLIAEVLRGSSGYIYYSGESYNWYDPKTFKGEPKRRFVHSQRVRS